MVHYVKKQILVEAFKIPSDDELDRHTMSIPRWFLNAFVSGIIQATVEGFIVKTNTGIAKCNVGDWLIKSPSNEIYPSTEVDFLANYEQVPDVKE